MSQLTVILVRADEQIFNEYVCPFIVSRLTMVHYSFVYNLSKISIQA